MPLVTEERYRALFYMPLYTFIHNLLNVLEQMVKWDLTLWHLLNVLLQIENKLGLYEKKKKSPRANYTD
jgi:hypothetical protein